MTGGMLNFEMEGLGGVPLPKSIVAATDRMVRALAERDDDCSLDEAADWLVENRRDLVTVVLPRSDVKMLLSLAMAHVGELGTPMLVERPEVP